MADIACPRCSADVWVRDVLVAAPAPAAEPHLRRSLDPLRWTCTTCGYQASHRGLLQWRLSAARVAHKGPLATAARSRQCPS